jgi:hypothetical protein
MEEEVGDFKGASFFKGILFLHYGFKAGPNWHSQFCQAVHDWTVDIDLYF